MKQRLFSIYDKIAHVYAKPILMQNAMVAIRSIRDAMENKDHEFAKHPEDYALYELGSFDDISGMIEMNNEGPIRIVFFNEILEEEK